MGTGPSNTPDTKDLRISLRRRMMRVLGLVLPRALTIAEQEVVRKTLHHCEACPHPEACARWLSTAGSADAPPEFCANADIFADLREASQSGKPRKG